MKNFFISSAYVYPLCPLSLNHMKMFVIGDIIARNERKKGKNVIFPIAMHNSGNSAERISKLFTTLFSKDKKDYSDEEKRTFNLYKNNYDTPINVLKTFNHPLNILDYYSQEILWEVKSLNISCDFKHFYSTKDKDFTEFVNTIIALYKKNGLLVYNKKGDLALDYNNTNWKKKILKTIDRAEFIQSFHKKNIISAIQDVRNDWPILRKNGSGVVYNKKWIIDPMFDSEILSIFDLYIRFRKNTKLGDIKSFFKRLFKKLKTKKKSNNILINKITDSLPCDVFISEEHLKNWVVKKLYSETFLLDKKYQTKKYFILGMGFLDGKQMSASKGHAILAKDLIEKYGPIKTRLIILLGGGHPSKMYEYDKSLPIYADKLLNGFIKHHKYLLNIINNKVSTKNAKKINIDIRLIQNNIKENIEKGYYRQAVIELLSILPKKIQKSPTKRTAKRLITIYKEYSDILLPGLLNYNLNKTCRKTKF